MALQFTEHAVQRYIQFHLMDVKRDPQEVRAMLEDESARAYKLKHKTHDGRTQWCIEALGCEMITVDKNGVDVVVTILPPNRFRGLTPQQAERAEALVRENQERQEALRLERERLAKEQSAATKRDASAEMKARANRNNGRLSELKNERAFAAMEHGLLMETLVAMRMQMTAETRMASVMAQKAVRALRAVLALTTKAEPSDLRDEIYRAVHDIEPAYLMANFLKQGGE